MRFSGLVVDEGREGLLLLALSGAARGQGAARPRCPDRRSTTIALGTPQSQDRLIYERKDLPTWFIGGDGHRGRPLPARLPRRRARTTTTACTTPIWAIRCSPTIGAPVKPVVEARRCGVRAVRQRGTRAVPADAIATRRTGRSSRIDLAQPAAAAWKTIVPEAQAVDRERALDRRHASSSSTSSTCRAGSRCSTIDGAARARSRCLAPGRSAGLSGRAGFARRSSTRSRRRCIPTTVFAYDLATRQRDAVRGADAADRREPGTRRRRCSRCRRMARACRSS